MAAFAHATGSAPSGTGMVGIERSGHRSIVTRAFATSPLRLLTPRNHGHAAWIYTATYGGGLVDGDALHLTVDVGAGAVAFLSTQASTKIYRSPSGTRVDVNAAVADEGVLVVAPDPVVCFAGAVYTQNQTFRMAPRAGLIVVDWLTSGRRAMGERWAFDSYVGRLILNVGERRLVYDALSLRADDGALATRMDRFNTVCVIVIAGGALARQAARVFESIAATPVVRHADLITGASLLEGDGCIVRLAGVSVEKVSGAIREHLRFMPGILGDDPWARKW